MSLISASELAAVQGVAESGLTTPVYIQDKVITQTDNGWVETWVERSTPTLGWLYEVTPVGATIGVIAGAMGIVDTLFLRFAVGTDVESGDRARIGTTILTIQHVPTDNTYAPWLNCGVKAVS